MCVYIYIYIYIYKRLCKFRDAEDLPKTPPQKHTIFEKAFKPFRPGPQFGGAGSCSPWGLGVSFRTVI